MHKSPRPEETSAKRGGACGHARLQRTGRSGTVARGIHPGRTSEADPGLEKKARRGRRKWIVGSAGLWRPRGSLVPASSDGTLPAARPPLFGAPRSPLRVDLRGAVSALRARPARSGRGADVFGPSRPAPCGAFREEALQSRRPPQSDATERPPRDRLPSACMTRCARGSSPEGSAGKEPRMGIDGKDYFLFYFRGRCRRLRYVKYHTVDSIRDHD